MGRVRRAHQLWVELQLQRRILGAHGAPYKARPSTLSGARQEQHGTRTPAKKQPIPCNGRSAWAAGSCPRLIHRSIPGLCAQPVAKCLKNKHLAKSPGALGSAPGLLMLRTELSTWIVDKPRRYSSACSFSSTIRSSARVSRCVCNCSRLRLCGTPSTAWAWNSSSPLMGAGTTSVFRLSRLTP